MKLVFLLTFLACCMACNAGTVDQSLNDPDDPNDPSAVNNSNDPNDPSDPSDPETIEAAFDLDKSSVKLLPFHIRMKKLEVVTGLPQTDPIFSELVNNRYSLGDHNYGSNIGPDLNWNASKMALWVKSIQPICNSDAMSQLYDLPNDLDALWLAAHSRPITAEEREGIDAIDVTNLDAAGQYETYCVSTLSSAEFVAQ